MRLTLSFALVPAAHTLPTLSLYDIINAERAYSESTYAKYAFGFPAEHMYHEGPAYSIINDTADELGMHVHRSPIHSSDIFYRAGKGLPAIADRNECVAVEMEAFALFANACFLHKSAATLLTVSDIIPTREQISADERERSLLPMMELALESCLRM